MVRALLDGRKTQTRRCGKRDFLRSGIMEWNGREMQPLPSYAPGDRLWVREAWGMGVSDHGDCPRYKATLDYQCGDKIISPHEGPFKWKSPIHMPRKFSRLTLTVTDVRVQRLQEISEADAVAEGVDAVSMADVPRQAAMSSRSDFAALWNSLHGPDAWDQNPWVVALTFDVHRCNIDRVGETT
ncbi:hypothetical protein [Roseovarius nitratireducens]|uniref:hypothetical protein n=1 Tax=Roseovarius nitratireducens TaxID=2044597 RepID=UPI00197E1C21|nr:hypothetical protein [Roseovarius nitratireducens]